MDDLANMLITLLCLGLILWLVLLPIIYGDHDE